MDVDGTLTDGKIYMGPDGEQFKAFNIKDGCGIALLLPPLGIEPVIITGRTSKIVENRCAELGITRIWQGVKDKQQQLLLLTQGHPEQAAYIGDDLNDLQVMSLVSQSGGFVGCPKDAAAAVREIAHFVSEKNGGDGAVRDFIEWLAASNAVRKNEE